MNLSNFSHAFLALLAQGVVYILTGNLWLGAAFGSAFYFGREVAQHESDRLKFFGHRAVLGGDDGMPWYEGFKVWDWSLDGRYDLLFPSAATCLVAYVV